MARILAKILAFGFALLVTAGCGSTHVIGLRVTNPDEVSVEFKGFYESGYTHRTEVDGVTKASYKVRAYKKGDHVRAGFVKTDPADSVSPLNVKLFYGGKRGEAEVVIPGDTAFIDFKF